MGTESDLGGRGGAFGREGKCTEGFPLCLIVQEAVKKSSAAKAFGVGGRTKCTRQWNAGMGALVLRRRQAKLVIGEKPSQHFYKVSVGFPKPQHRLRSRSNIFRHTAICITSRRLSFPPFCIASLRCPKLSSPALRPRPSSGIKVICNPYPFCQRVALIERRP